MSREVNIGSRKFWIVSEPHDKGWKAQVLEVVDETGGTQDIGIETTGETRSMADDRAIGQLQHRLRDSPSKLYAHEQLGGARDGAEKVGKIERLHDVIVEAGVEDGLPIGVGGESGQRNRAALAAVSGCRAADRPQHLVPIHPGHGEVADEHIECVARATDRAPRAQSSPA